MFLADMTETSFSTDTNRLEKGHDDAGSELKVNGQPSPKGLMMQPPREGMARAVYSLDKKAKLFTADVGVNPFPYNAPSSPLTFVLLGDGAVLWTSPLIVRPSRSSIAKSASPRSLTWNSACFARRATPGPKPCGSSRG